MFKNSSTFYRLVIHSIGVLVLVGVLGSTAISGEGILSTVVQTLYEATFGTGTVETTTEGTSPLSNPPPAPMSSGPGDNPPPPDSLR